MTTFEFYRDRLAACPNYGFREGHKILDIVLSQCIFYDATLTTEEFNSIIRLADEAHIKMMEDDFNDGWEDCK